MEFKGIGKYNIELKKYSRWKIGGPADFFAEPGNIDQLKALLNFSRSKNIPFQVIGDSTNILFDDKGYRGLIIRLGQNFNKYHIKDDTIEAEAGAWVPCLARASANVGLSGLEHTVGIPGTIGGLVIMNGGSLRKSISENIQKVFAIDYSGKQIVFKKDDCKFQYRRSVFQNSPYIVYKVELKLQKANPNVIRNEMLGILESRRKKFPLKLPNCGSVFISHPVLYDTFGPPGKIIEDMGFKGYSRGGAAVSELHANFIVNKGNATATDIIDIVKFIRGSVFEKTNIHMESEIRYLDRSGKIKFLHEI